MSIVIVKPVKSFQATNGSDSFAFLLKSTERKPFFFLLFQCDDVLRMWHVTLSHSRVTCQMCQVTSVCCAFVQQVFVLLSWTHAIKASLRALQVLKLSYLMLLMLFGKFNRKLFEMKMWKLISLTNNRCRTFCSKVKLLPDTRSKNWI